MGFKHPAQVLWEVSPCKSCAVGPTVTKSLIWQQELQKVSCVPLGVFWQNYIHEAAVTEKQQKSSIFLSVAHTVCPPSAFPATAGGKNKTLLGGFSPLVLAVISGGFSSAPWGAA